MIIIAIRLADAQYKIQMELSPIGILRNEKIAKSPKKRSPRISDNLSIMMEMATVLTDLPSSLR
jgi:hypothetical protein